MKFSCRFSQKEIQERWYQLLYDPVVSRFVSFCLTYINLILFVFKYKETRFQLCVSSKYKIMTIKSAIATKNNFTESATLGRSTCTFKLNVRCFLQNTSLCILEFVTVKPLLSGHLRDPPKCPPNRGCPLYRDL